MTLLPRPLTIDPAKEASLARRAMLAIGLFLLVGGGFAVGTYFFGSELLQERELWKSGLEGRVVSFDGRVTERTIIVLTISYSYEVDVAYEDQNGNAHTGTAKFDYFWSDLERNLQPTLRYDAADPSKFVLSFEAEGGLPRYGFAILMAALAAMMFFGVIGAARTERERRRITRMVAEDGEEIAAELVSIAEVQGNYTVVYRLPEDPSGEKRNATLPVPPLVVGAEAARVLVLRSPRDRAAVLVVRSDLSPFAIDATSAQMIAEAAATATT